MRFKRLTAFICVIVLIFTMSLSAFSYTVDDDTTVFVTDYGEKYHREGCPYLLSINGMTIEMAEEQGFEACERCHPDYLTGVYHPGIGEYMRTKEGKAVAGGVIALLAIAIGAVVLIKKNKKKKLEAVSSESVPQLKEPTEYEILKEKYGGKRRSEIASMLGKPEFILIDSKGEPVYDDVSELVWYPEYKETLQKLYDYHIPVLADIDVQAATAN